MKTLLSTLLVALSFTSLSQTVVTHFNASWNKHNKADWVGELRGCVITYVDISASPLICKSHKITSVPTIIIFHNGKEVKRFHGGIGFRVRKATQEQLQDIVNGLQPTHHQPKGRNVLTLEQKNQFNTLYEYDTQGQNN